MLASFGAPWHAIVRMAYAFGLVELVSLGKPRLMRWSSKRHVCAHEADEEPAPAWLLARTFWRIAGNSFSAG